MTKEQFDEFINEVIPQQLFHVEPTDIDDESGAQLDEVILVGLIANDPSCLKHKSLQWFLDKFLINAKPVTELFCETVNNKRDEVCPDCMGAGEHISGGSFGGPTMIHKCFSCRGTGRIKR